MNDYSLKEMAQPHEDDARKRYYRPFVSSSPDKKHDIFLIGINPTTPIYEHEVEHSEYVRLLTDYDAFYRKYEEIRLSRGKQGTSRTRVAIKSFVSEIQNQTGKAVLETNVIPYPTANIKELKQAPPAALAKAEQIFYQLLMGQTPAVLLVHGKKSLNSLLGALASNQLLDNASVSLDLKMKDIEKAAPFLTFTYPNGEKGAVFACRHFMYYGRTGSSFSEFKESVIHYLNKERG